MFSIDSLTSSSSTNLTESKTPEHQHSSSTSSTTTPEFCRIHLRQTANTSNSKTSADSESTSASESVPSSVGMAIRLFFRIRIQSLSRYQIHHANHDQRIRNRTNHRYNSLLTRNSPITDQIHSTSPKESSE